MPEPRARGATSWARDSIFLKILFIFLIAGLAAVLLMRVFERKILWNDLRRQHRSKNLGEYAKFLARERPFPPTREDLAQLSERLHIRTRVRGPGFEMTSDAEVPSEPTIRERLVPRYVDDVVMSGRAGEAYGLIVQGPHETTWFFLLETESDLDSNPSLILFPLLGVLTILSASYFAIRHVLSPLREIERGVREVAAGNLQPALRAGSRDELGRLTRSFNTMTEQIRTMIAAKEQLLLDVSHEFRSPLTRIKVAMELNGNEGRESIVRALRDLETMLAELLESARLNDPQGGLRKVPADLAAMMRELAVLHEDQAPGIDVQAGPTPLIVAVDPARMQMALRNLVENALKYSAGQSRPVTIRWDANEHAVFLRVRDHGVGIAAEDRTLIFEPFYRVDRARLKATGGYGLGLSLARKVAEAHGGRLTVESQVGVGAEFTMELPRLESHRS